jgi:CRISPR-associated protein Csd1
MILQALYRLAQREGLLADADYEPKPVAWLIRLDPTGRLVGIEGTHTLPEAGGRRKPRPVPATFSVPRHALRTSGDRPQFFCDKAEYVLGVDPDGRRTEERLRRRSALFRDQVRQCAEATGDEGASAVLRFLEDVAAGRQEVRLPCDCVGNDLFAFVYQPDIDRLVTEREAVRAYWKTRRADASGGMGSARCLVSGSAAGSPVNFPQLKKVPGKGTSSGISLVSFNESAFESFGWTGNENAPISKDAAEACATGLNRLLDRGYPDPDHPGQALPRRNIQLSADTVVCYWSAVERGDEFCNIFGGLLEGNPEEVGNLYRSYRVGKGVDVRDPSAFYALTLTGQRGRAIVRDWFESTVADVARNLEAHFRDLEVVRGPRTKEAPTDQPIGLPVLMEAIAQPAERRSEGVPAHLAAQFVRAALSGRLYPIAMLQRAVLRYRAELGSESQNDKVRAWRVRQWNEARAALIKAVLNRRVRAGISTVSKEVTVTMDPGNQNEGYVLGQLMAVFERLQQLALSDANASVIDRFFTGASAAPKTVFVRLYRNARHHARKALDGDSPGMAIRLERLIDELSARFGLESAFPYAHQNALPVFLDLEQQGLFVLGYHQMRRWLWMSRGEREDWEEEHPDAPRAYLWGSRQDMTVKPAEV